MKILTSIVVASAVALTAGAASAQQNMNVGGEAEKLCTLPNTWSFVSGAAGATGSQFANGTWTLPESAFADSAAAAVAGPEYAIRVRGTGFCNASHTIRLESTRGGLRSAAAPVAGFSNGRPIRYEAYWSGNGGASTNLGPQAILTATTAGQQSAPANYTVSGALPPPGNRTFDIRMGMARGALTQPLLAGAYSDTVTITIALAP